jgi:type III restriction enzyme
MDSAATVHEINLLTVVASESYKDFVAGLQRDISQSLERPRKADEAYFNGKMFKTDIADVLVTPLMAKAIYRYLVKSDYTDNADQITPAYHEAETEGKLAALPPELAPYAPQIFQLIDGVFSDSQIPLPDDGRKARVNPLNANFHKKEFLDLWGRINRKAAFTVQFETPELVQKCVAAIEKELKVSPLQYTIQRGEQTESTTFENLQQGLAFELQETETGALKASIQSAVKYDLIGKLAEQTKLTRRTIGTILQSISVAVFSQYRMNPEDFMLKAGRLINEQKATVIVEHLTYDPVDESHELDIFTQEKPRGDFSKGLKADRHIYDYVFTDSGIEREFVRELDTGTDVVVYAKLPKTFFIPTPVGNYNPDWAIAFQEGTVKHIYFIAETKGSLSSMELRKIEDCKIDCARKFFHKITSDQVKYDVVNSYAKLMELVK